MFNVKSFLTSTCVLAILMGCGARGGAAAGDAAAGNANPAAISGPRVYDVTPDSVRAGEAYPAVLMIHGEGFDREGNVLRLGDVLTDTVPSGTGTSIRWDMPKSVRLGSEVPPMVIQPGRYELTVQTAEGVSNPVIVTVTPER